MSMVCDSAANERIEQRQSSLGRMRDGVEV